MISLGDKKLVKELNGHSGCAVCLMENKVNKSFVRKISSSVEYNDRLYRQMKKQQKFKSDILKSPPVLGDGIIEDKFYFDMEYIQGSSFDDFVQKGSVSNVKKSFNTILRFIEANNDLGEGIKEDMKTKVKNLQLGRKYNYYKDYCLDFDWEKINKSYCHGDLTFENFIVSGNEIFLIDFLDSFVDTKIMDYAKIFQELYCFWSRRHLGRDFNIKYIILDQMIDLHEFEKQAALKMLVLNLLRILPYSDESTIQFIEYQLKNIVEKINGE
jgi:hypothetical protein